MSPVQDLEPCSDEFAKAVMHASVAGACWRAIREAGGGLPGLVRAAKHHSAMAQAHMNATLISQPKDFL